MTDKRPPAPPPVPKEIVSVNSRGGASTGMGGKIAFCFLVAALIVIGSLFGFAKYRAAKADSTAAQANSTKEENKPAQVGPRRTFNTDPVPTRSPAPSTAPTAENNAIKTNCPDGSIGQPMVDASGHVVPSPTGAPLRICANGQYIVPAIVPIPSDATLSVPGHNISSTGAQRTLPISSRFGGEILVAQSTTPLAATATEHTAQETTASDVSIQSAAMTVPHRAAPANSANDAHGTEDGGHVHARMIGDRDMILPQGRTIDCNLSVRLINEVSGKATCVLSSDVYSSSGKVILAERGSTAVGDYVAQMAQGQRRLFVMWTRLETPKGVLVDLGSPAADALGTTGLTGQIDNRWADRIGAAFLLSLIDDAIGYQTAKASTAEGGGAAQGITVFQNSTQTGRSMAERVLDSTINIKPTLYKNQGDRATIYVSRDLDFGSVYALRAQ